MKRDQANIWKHKEAREAGYSKMTQNSTYFSFLKILILLLVKECAIMW